MLHYKLEETNFHCLTSNCVGKTVTGPFLWEREDRWHQQHRSRHNCQWNRASWWQRSEHCKLHASRPCRTSCMPAPLKTETLQVKRLCTD